MRMQNVFLILSGILFFFISPCSAVPTNKIQLNAKKVAIDAGARLVIPCYFSSSRRFKTDNVQLEWGMVPEQGGNYKPVYLLYNNQEPLIQPNERAHSLLPRQKGNCSLVISPTQIEDSGTYQIHFVINGVRYTSTTDVKVHVKTCVESYGADYCTCDEVEIIRSPGLSKSTILIIAGCVSGGLLFMALIGGFVGCHLYRRKKDVVNMMEEGRMT